MKHFRRLIYCYMILLLVLLYLLIDLSSTLSCIEVPQKEEVVPQKKGIMV